jgi:hypothetical protein
MRGGGRGNMNEFREKEEIGRREWDSKFRSQETVSPRAEGGW